MYDCMFNTVAEGSRAVALKFDFFLIMAYKYKIFL